jgi:DNA polymerase III subunit chi
MARIEFHFNAPGLVNYACRLLRKVQGRGMRAQVLGHASTLAQLDQGLWTFSTLDFVPHCGVQAPEHMLQASTVLLTEVPHADWHRQVLINLGDAVPEGFDRFERIIEVVTVDELHRSQARDRWREYARMGHELVRHDLLQAPSGE